MSGRDEWNEVVARLHADGDPLKSPHLRDFYALAIRDGKRFLASFERTLGEDRILDLIHDVLADVKRVVNAATPRAFFCTALQRRAISWRRRGDAKVVEMPPEEAQPVVARTHDEDSRRAFVLDARQVLDALTDRDRRVVVAVGEGDDREAIAREHGITRDAVDHILFRARKRFAGGDS